LRHFFFNRGQRSRHGMSLLSIAAYAVLLLAALAGTVHAATPAPLRTELTLTRIAVDTWRADYIFAKPVTAIELGAQIGPYRSQAWCLLTPGVALVAHGDDESLRSAAPLTRLSIEISAYDAFVDGQYAPIGRFSDGGMDFYLGFLYGTLTQGGRKRSMDVALHLHGLPGETVVAPARPGTELTGYAYFGPQKPGRMGNIDVIIDPQAPAWLREVIDDTTAKVSRFYEQAFQRKLPDVPLVSVAMVGFDGQPGNISIMARLVAHEMAHLWQVNLKRGGIGETDAWVHEGGAEAMALEALRATGIFTEEASRQYAQDLLKECEALKDDVTVNRGLYACGFKRFHGYAMPPVPLWRAMMARSEDTGEFYSEPMIRAILDR
jgi:hypothetical protein